ncbi:MAG TPA: hypothetical protein DCP37_03500 [Dehalococcoidia bacterium]|nr:hypothetical protein [Dehalococcoidia bacterium]
MRWRLRTTFRVFTTVLITSLGIAVLAVAWFEGRATVRESAHAVVKEVAEAVESELREHLEVPDRALTLAAEMMGDGALDPNNFEALEEVFTDFLEIHQEVSALQYRSVAGRRLEVLRDPVGSIHSTSNPTPETGAQSAWYDRWAENPPTAPVESAYWGPAVVRQDLGVPAVTGSRPVADPDSGLIGVMAVEVSLLDVSRFMADLEIGLSGESFVLDGGGRLVAIADTLALLRPDDAAEEFALHELNFAHRPEVGVFGQRPEVAATLGGASPTRMRFFVGGVPYLGSLGPIEPSPVGNWYVGVIVPEDDFLGELKRTIVIGFALLLGALIVAGISGDWFSRYLARSLARLVEETEQVRELNFQSRGIPESVFRELHDVLAAFESMKVGVRSFARYVPVKVVRRLIESGSDARSGGELRTLTLLFGDIADFTTLSEGVEPDRMTEKLNAYFAGVTEAIEGCGGILDKYLGDGVMAFLGRP